MNELITDLVLQGLTEKESRVYLTLFEKGQSSAYALANASGLKRSTTYVVLEDLMQKGLVLKVPKVKKQMFVAKSLEELKVLFSERFKAANRVVEKLERLKQPEQNFRTLYFEGMKGLREAVYYRIKELKGKPLTGFWSKDNGIKKEIIDLFMEWNMDVKKAGGYIQGVTPDHSSTRKYLEFYPEDYDKVTLLPENIYSPDVSIDFTDDFVRIIDAIQMKATIIEN